MAGDIAIATIFAASAPVGIQIDARRGPAWKRNEERADMSEEAKREQDEEFNEDGPGINGGLASWLYVLGGIPLMILFFVVLFTMVGTCDAQNTMIYG
jgi:hypothetical protein